VPCEREQPAARCVGKVSRCGFVVVCRSSGSNCKRTQWGEHPNLNLCPTVQDGETVVNEGLQQGGSARKTGKKKGAKAASTNTEDHSGRGQVRAFFTSS